MVVDNAVNKLFGLLINVLYLPWSGIEVFVVAIKLKDNILISLYFWSFETDELTNVTKSMLIFIEFALAITILCCASESKEFVWTLDRVRSVVNEIDGISVDNVGACVAIFDVGWHVGGGDVGRHVGAGDVGPRVAIFDVGRHVGGDDVGPMVAIVDVGSHVGRYVGGDDVGRHVGTIDGVYVAIWFM